MDFLIPAFHEELKDESRCYVEDGRVFIGGKYWTPEEILKLISEETHREIFNEWIEERKENLIQIADDFLNEFDQIDRFNKLKQTYKNNAVIPFVGAGLSEPSGYPMWTPFLKTLQKHSGISENQILERFSKGEYEEAAQDLSDSLGPAFNEELENAFGIKRDLNGSVQFLPLIFNGPVITTNYDNVLKRVYEQQSKSFEETIPGYLATDIVKHLAAGDRVLIMLHGKAMTGSGRVLTMSEYNEHYVKGDVINTVISSVCTKTLLFLGCSLSVDRTLTAMKNYAEQKGHANVARHYAFLPTPDTQELRNEKRKKLADSNIYPIWYSGGDHDQAIEAFFHKLSE